MCATKRTLLNQLCVWWPPCMRYLGLLQSVHFEFSLSIHQCLKISSNGDPSLVHRLFSESFLDFTMESSENFPLTFSLIPASCCRIWTLLFYSSGLPGKAYMGLFWVEVGEGAEKSCSVVEIPSISGILYRIQSCLHYNTRICTTTY